MFLFHNIKSYYSHGILHPFVLVPLYLFNLGYPPINVLNLQVKECLPRLAKLIKSNNEAVLRDACWGVMYMCKLSIQEVLDSGACEFHL